jgi:anaerobic magnesium-protoporphyrin IX monomethyl ester cyclase
MRIVFVHTPMPAVAVPERQDYWRYFDVRYHMAHQHLGHMKNIMWELPHWMHWLGGVLVAEGFTDIGTLNFYNSSTALAGIDREEFRRDIQCKPAEIYLLSPMTPNLPFALEIADCIKDVYPDATVIFGGIVATPLHRTIAAHASVDFVVWERGEYALPALLRTLREKKSPVGVGNLSYKGVNGMVITSPLQYPDMPVEKIPFPKVDLFSPSTGEDLRYIRLVYGLGCPYKCSFCTIQTIGRKTSYFPLERVLAELRAYRAYYGQHHNIYWGDETFTVNSQRTLALCHALEEEGAVEYDCQTRLNCLTDPNVIKALYRSGCRWIEVGLETGVQESQDLHKQRVKLDVARDILSRLRDEGISVCSFMVNGLPNETVEQMQRSIEWVCSLIDEGLLQASYLFGLTPYPGSDMYHSPEKYGMEILHHDYRLYHEDMPPVFRTPHTEPDAAYSQFLRGISCLSEAMARKPYFGQMPTANELNKFGAFWEASHN